jgi:hypothetical protein
LPGLFSLPLLRQRVGKILKDAKRALFQAQYLASFGQPGVITQPPGLEVPPAIPPLVLGDEERRR